MPTYSRVLGNQWRRRATLEDIQNRDLRQAVHHAYERVPYYHKLFKQLGLKPSDIRAVSDLEKVPILTKSIVKKNWSEFKPVNLRRIEYYERVTGGSTGTPFQYRISRHDRLLSATLLYRGWGYGTYEPGDRMVFLGGAAIGVVRKKGPLSQIEELMRNVSKLSSFDMGDANLEEYANHIKLRRPRFIRGYPSSIACLARYIEQHGISVPKVEGVFTTSEKLHPHMREKIRAVFNCEVFDNYGLNDGGVTAYECKEHSGLHVDTDRSLLEIVDGNGARIDDGEGVVLATSLHNEAMPFIRYDTGDIARISSEECSCGRHHRLLKDVTGRSVDILTTPEGTRVHGWLFLYTFWEVCKGIEEYQVVQENLETIRIRIVIDETFEDSQLEKIEQIVRDKSPGWNVQFEIVGSIDKGPSGKSKFIESRVKEGSE